MTKARTGLCALALIFLVASPGLALGQKEAPSDEAEGLENWRHSVDLAGLKPGVYNIMVKGSDLAGNVAIGGPINVVVDPSSDLPIVSIINPTPLSRVGGDLVLVGSCIDDDGVAKVEVSLDGGDFVPAQGGEFWSLTIPAAAISDGRRSIAVRGTDLNGTLGPVAKVTVDFDRSAPKSRVDRPEVGALVAGKIQLAGEVSDPNGLKSLELSQDGGKTFFQIKLGRTGKPDKASFSLPLDTRKFPDGPKVLWLRSIDAVGSRGEAAFLLFVDNTKPSLELARPLKGQPVNGKFVIAGTVKDAVGLARLTYDFAGLEKGEIPLVPGDPFFAKTLDAGLVKGDKAKLVLTAQDRIGNTTSLVLEAPIDRKADLPRVTIAFPAPGASLEAGQLIWGSLSDDDGCKGLRYSVDGGQPRELAASEFFSIPVEGLRAGKHSLSLQAQDLEGLWGEASSLAFVVDGGPATVSFLSLVPPKAGAQAEASQPYEAGALFRVDGGLSLEGRVDAANPLVSASYGISGSAPRKLELAQSPGSTAFTFRIPLDRSFPYGFVALEVTVTDSQKRTATGRALLYSLDLSREREDTGFVFDDPRIGADGKIRLSEGGVLKGAFYREEVASLRLEPPTSLVVPSFEGRTIVLKAVGEGSTPPTVLVATTAKGREFSSKPLSFLCDARPPALALAEPQDGAWARSSIVFRGRAQDGGGLDSIAYRVGGGPWIGLVPDAMGDFSGRIEVADLPQGPLALEVLAKDRTGNSARVFRTLGVDREGPRVDFLSPAPASAVAGPEDVAAVVADLSGLAGVEYSPDGVSFQAVDFKGQAFIHRADFAAHPKGVYRLTDRAGNVSLAAPSLTQARPEAFALVRSLALAPSPDLPASPSLSFSGAEGAQVLDFSGQARTDLSPGAPQAQRLLVYGRPSFKGKASAPGPLKSVLVSYDGGTSYAPLFAPKDEKSYVPEVSLSFSPDLSKAPEGPSSWVFKLEDAAGALAYVEVPVYLDKTGPEAKILSPGAGPVLGPLPLVLYVSDPTGLSEALVQIGEAKSTLAVQEGGSYYALWLEPKAGSTKPENVSIGLKALDAAGNAGAASLKTQLDPGQGPLSLAILPAATGKSGEAKVLAPGSLIEVAVAPSSGSASLKVILDGEEHSLDVPAWTLSADSLGPGLHKLRAEARDAYGRSVQATRDFLVPDTSVELSDIVLISSTKTMPWVPGIEVDLDGRWSLGGQLKAPLGSAALEYRLGQGPFAKASLGKPDASTSLMPFSCPLPQGQARDRLVVELRLKDGQGQEASWRYDLHNILPALATAPPSDSADALRFYSSALTEAPAGPSLSLKPGEAVEGLWMGRPLASLAIQPTTKALSVDYQASKVSLKALAEGSSNGVAYRVIGTTIDGDPVVFGPFSYMVDASPPVLNLDGPDSDTWLQGSLELRGSASDSLGLAGVYYSLNGSETKALEGLAPGRPFSAVISLDTLPDGLVRLDVLARDLAGKESRVVRFILKDVVAPQVSQVLPAPDLTVNGTTTLIVQVTDAGRVASQGFDDGTKGGLASLDSASIVAFEADLARLKLDGAGAAAFVVADKAGNVSRFTPSLKVDPGLDKPVIEIQAPADLEVLRSDFSIAGTCYDDDGVAELWYRLDGGLWNRVAVSGASFDLPQALADNADNEHLVDLYAVDLYGVKSEIVSRRYRISRAEPTAALASPSLDSTVRGTITLSGTAQDANGIASLSLSFDNGVTWVLAQGGASWSYVLDTSILTDGLHPVALRPVDRYSVQGFSAGFINVDNTPPVVDLSLPLDGAAFASSLPLSGRVSDGQRLESARAEIAPVGMAKPALLSLPLGVGPAVVSSLDISSLAPGSYTLRLVARDKARNETFLSRDIEIQASTAEDRIEILFPVGGETATGALRIGGRATLHSKVSSATVLVDGKDQGSATLDSLGYFVLELPPGALADGHHVVVARIVNEAGKAATSREVGVELSSQGPWISIDSIPLGSYLRQRPYLSGKAGFLGPAKDEKGRDPRPSLSKVEISLDNGRSFSKVAGTANWKYRLETLDMPEGGVFVLARATFSDGSVAVAKSLFSLDKTPPEVRVLEPREGAHLNATVVAAGSAKDATGLKSVEVALRKGDKRGYEVPSFIQGLYIDSHFLGATYWDVGAGLSFFQDNVKLQVEYGQAPEDGRFGGTVYGAKLLANIVYLPASYLLGPDWDFLSASFAVGANFSYFSTSTSGEGLVLGAVVAQIEFPKITFKRLTFMKKYSFYAEGQAWFVSSDVQGGVEYRLSFGARVGLF